jgi:hypothetical protein
MRVLLNCGIADLADNVFVSPLITGALQFIIPAPAKVCIVLLNRNRNYELKSS